MQDMGIEAKDLDFSRLGACDRSITDGNRQRIKLRYLFKICRNDRQIIARHMAEERKAWTEGVRGRRMFERVCAWENRCHARQGVSLGAFMLWMRLAKEDAEGSYPFSTGRCVRSFVSCQAHESTYESDSYVILG